MIWWHRRLNFDQIYDILPQYFLRTIMEGSEDIILTPSNTTGTDKQFGGTEDFRYSSVFFKSCHGRIRIHDTDTI